MFRTFSRIIPATRTNSTRLSTININRAMSTSTNDQKITDWASKDGSFKRQVSSFRDAIEKGGKFEPEKGELFRLF
jgi:hypothetical protein